MVLLAIPRSSTALSTCPIVASCSIIPSAYSVLEFSPGLSRCVSRTWVRKCMRVELNQQKNGRFARACLCMKSIAAADVSSSIVSMRFFVSGPVSSILPSAKVRSTPRGPNLLRNSGSCGYQAVLRVFFGVEMIEIAEKLIEAMIGRQILVLVAKVVLAELTGSVSERLEQFGERCVTRLQAHGCGGNTHFREPGAQRALTVAPSAE